MSLSAAIFRRGGMKKELFNDEEADVEVLDPDKMDEIELTVKLKELTEVLAVPKAGRDLSAAIWRPEVRAAEIVKARRGVGLTNGFTWRKKSYLHIEEALFFVDRGDLLLFVETPSAGVPSSASAPTQAPALAAAAAKASTPLQRLLSLQECYEMMLGLGVSMERYTVSSKLQRSGFLVTRHPSRWVLGHEENPATLWTGAWGNASSGVEQHPPDVRATPSHDQPWRRKVHAVRSNAREEPMQVDLIQQQQSAPSLMLPPQQRQQRQQAAAPLLIRQRQWWPAIGPEHGAMKGVPQEYFDNTPSTSVVPSPGAELRAKFPRLQPFGQIPRNTLIGKPSSSCNIVFDVYKPGSKVARKQGTFPDIMCHVAISSGGPPPLQDMQHADAQSIGGAPVNWAAVEDGIVSFYSVGTIDLIKLL